MKIENYDFETGFLEGCAPIDIDIDEGNKEKPRLKLNEFKHKWKLIVEVVKITKINKRILLFFKWFHRNLPKQDLRVKVIPKKKGIS